MPYPGQTLLPVDRWQSVREQYGLTARELQVAQLVFDDMKDSEIAAQLNISSHTVNSHLRRLYRKLQITSRVGLIVRMVDTAYNGDLRS